MMTSTQRSTAAVLAAIACVCGAVRPARAQTAADTAALARATASFIADSLLSPMRAVVIWHDFNIPFGSAVAENLRDNTRLPGPGADPRHPIYFGVRSVAMAADSAVVLVESWQQYAETGLLQAWREQNEYVFRRTGDDWRFVRHASGRHFDAGPVRGREKR